MKPRMTPKTQQVIAEDLARMIRSRPEATILCVSSACIAPDGIKSRTLRHVGFSKELNTIVIEYYE